MQKFNSELDWLWIGTWSMGGEGWGPTDLRESVLTLETAISMGLKRFDTAPVYSRGASEKLLGDVIGGARKEIFISTKGGLNWDGHKIIHEGSPAALKRHLEESLRRLRMEYVDLFQLHWPDPAISISQSIEGMESLKRDGFTHEVGVGNLSADQVMGLIPPGANYYHQLPFSLLSRPWATVQAGRQGTRCRAVAYSPFEQGLFCSRKHDRGAQTLPPKDVRKKNMHFRSKEALDWIHQFHKECIAQKLNPMVIALAWLRLNPEIDSVIVGPRTVQQLKDLHAAAKEAESWKESWPVSPEFQEIIRKGLVYGQNS